MKREVMNLKPNGIDWEGVNADTMHDDRVRGAMDILRMVALAAFMLVAIGVASLSFKALNDAAMRDVGIEVTE